MKKASLALQLAWATNTLRKINNMMDKLTQEASKNRHKCYKLLDLVCGYCEEIGDLRWRYANTGEGSCLYYEEIVYNRAVKEERRIIDAFKEIKQLTYTFEPDYEF